MPNPNPNPNPHPHPKDEYAAHELTALTNTQVFNYLAHAAEQETNSLADFALALEVQGEDTLVFRSGFPQSYTMGSDPGEVLGEWRRQGTPGLHLLELWVFVVMRFTGSTPQSLARRFIADVQSVKHCSSADFFSPLEHFFIVLATVKTGDRQACAVFARQMDMCGGILRSLGPCDCDCHLSMSSHSSRRLDS